MIVLIGTNHRRDKSLRTGPRGPVECTKLRIRFCRQMLFTQKNVQAQTNPGLSILLAPLYSTVGCGQGYPYRRQNVSCGPKSMQSPGTLFESYPEAAAQARCLPEEELPVDDYDY